jgi:hypothetical protein
MSNPLSKLAVFSVLLSISTATSANWFLKMGVAPPTAFPPGVQLKVIGQAFNVPNGGTHPYGLRLQDGRTDASWNFIPASVHTEDVNFGSPNAAHWSGASFSPFPAPPNSPTHRFKIIATIIRWVPIGAPDGPGAYRPAQGLGSQTTALFQYKCLPVNPKRPALCRWQRQ